MYFVLHILEPLPASLPPSSRLHESLHIAGMGTKIEYIPQGIVAHISPLHVTKTTTVTYISTMLSDKYTLPIAWEVNEDLLSTFKCHDCPGNVPQYNDSSDSSMWTPNRSTPCVSGHGYHDDDQNSNIPQVVFAHRCQLEGWWDWQVPKPFEMAPSWIQWLMHVHHLVINWVSWYEPILIYV